METQISQLNISTELFDEATCTAAAATPVSDSSSIISNLKGCKSELDNDSGSRIESLPPEIRRHLLSSLDLPRLDALIHASPTFHQQFITDRQHILSSIFKEPLNSALGLAYAVHLRNSAPTKDHETISEFLDQYLPSSRPPAPINLCIEESYSIMDYYSYYIEPMVQYYIRWLFNNLAKKMGDSSIAERNATGPEIIRLTRAMYLYQMLSDISFAEPPAENVIQRFLDLLQPWECEQVLAIYQFADYSFEKGFEKFGGQEQLLPSEDSVEAGSLRGLAVIHPIIFNSEDKEQLATMLIHFRCSWIALSTIYCCFGKEAQDERRRSDVVYQDLVRETQELLVDDTSSSSESPPPAWMEIWGDKCRNLYGWYTSDYLRRWGYVFWDAQTLDSTGGRELLKQQWEDRKAGKGKLKTPTFCVIL